MFEEEIKIDNLEQQQILDGFKGEGISIQSISEHLFKNGVLVKLVIGRKRLKYSYDFKGFGIDFEKTNSNEFATEHMENGKISVLPIYLEKRLTSIEGSLRNRQKRLSTGFNDQYMPLVSYAEFKKDFEVTRQEFFNVRDEIITNWDSLVENYKERLAMLLRDLNAIERDHLYNEMVNSIPSKEEYKKSYKMFMNVKTMPKLDQSDDLDDEITAIMSKDIVAVIYETVQGCLEKACVLSNSAINGFKNGEIGSRTLGAIKTISNTLRTRNVVANNPKVNEVADLFDEAVSIENQDDLASMMEIVLAKSYVYADDNNIPLKINPVLSLESLRRIDNLS